MGKLAERDYRSLKPVLSNFILRNHAPLWVLWVSISLSLSLFLLSLATNLANWSSPFSFRSPDFRGSWWTAHSVAVVMMMSPLISWMAYWCTWKGKNRLKMGNKLSLPTEPSQCAMAARKTWYNYPLFFFKLIYNSYNFYAYKLWLANLENHNLLFSLSITQLLTELSVLVLLAWLPGSEMAPTGNPGNDKDKGKAPMGAFSTPNKINSNSTNSTNVKHLPNPQLPLGGPTSKTKAKKGGCSSTRLHLTAMFNKLAAARENGKKEKKGLTFVGFLVGESKEFPRIFAKLRMDWKPVKGILTFSALKYGWFEVSCSNQEDFHQIWANRPYHIFSQLLLLKQWYSGFDPTSESISQLDLWVRLHYLPEEFANSDALETIIEGNSVGRFLKMDPSHNSDQWNLFTRFCINTNVEITMGKGVIVPDEHLNQIKFTLWFDDLSPGCGACGKSAHTFKSCSSKNPSIPTLQLTIKKPSSKNHAPANTPSQPREHEKWNTMGKNNKVAKTPTIAIPNSNIYLSEKGGINVTFESDDSEDSLQQLLENEEIFCDNPNLVAVAADLHPYNIITDGKNVPTSKNDKGGSSIPLEVEIIQKKKLLNNLEFAGTTIPLDEKWLTTNTKTNQQEMKIMNPNQSTGRPSVCFTLARKKHAFMRHLSLSYTWSPVNSIKSSLETEFRPDVFVHVCRIHFSSLLFLWLFLLLLAQTSPLAVGRMANNKTINCETLGNMVKTHIREPLLAIKEPLLGKMDFGGISSLSVEDGSPKPHLIHPLPLPNLTSEKFQPQQLEEEMSEYEEEQYDYEFDDLLVDEMQENDLPLITGNTIMISDDPPFSEKDLEEFINNDILDGNEEHVVSEGTFHSTKNSILSSSSFVNGMERLIVQQPDQSKSTSSKRKITEGMEDTATSETREGKKTKY